MKKKTTMEFYLALQGIKTKKISLNMEIQVLELADDLAKLIETDRTTVLMTSIGLGVSPYMKLLKKEWGKLRKSNPEKKSKIDVLLKKLSKIEAKHVKRSY